MFGERKYLTDAIKMICCRAESTLSSLLDCHILGIREENRAILKGVLEQQAEIVADEAKGVLSVYFHPMANLRFNRPLRDLCAIINAEAFFCSHKPT